MGRGQQTRKLLSLGEGQDLLDVGPPERPKQDTITS
jgi:hypothetical protein